MGRCVLFLLSFFLPSFLSSLPSFSLPYFLRQRAKLSLVLISDLMINSQAEKAFFQARVLSPHNLDSMELYSTLLWHLRLPTQLSFLAQDLMTLAPKAPASWIASGNVFSHLEDHAAALKCFKRAAQLDEACVYAYTLSGHECVVLEEWERALAFFREAVRLDARHYNAWLVFLSYRLYRRKKAKANENDVGLD